MKKSEARSKELIIMCGLPGSGKSTYINKHFINSHQIICADDIRLVIGQVFHIGQEPIIHAICETMVAAFMERGLSVCIDEMNTRYDTVKKWVNLANRYGYYKKLIFLHIDIDECKRRRGCRKGLFPEEVIDRMAKNIHSLFTELDFHGNIVDEIITVKE